MNKKNDVIDYSYVCEYCMEGIESHEGTQRKIYDTNLIKSEDIKYGFIDDDGDFQEDTEYDNINSDDYVRCCWCENMFPLDEIIIW